MSQTPSTDAYLRTLSQGKKSQEPTSNRIQREFLIQQYYIVTPDGSIIDKRRAEHTPHTEEATNWLKVYFDRMHSMFAAILANEKALSLVSEYCVIGEHDTQTSGSGEYLEAHYDGKEPSFLEILAQVLECFSEEDRTYLQMLLKNLEEYRAELARGEYENGEPYELDELRECFKIEPSGWDIEPHIHGGK